MGKQPARGKKPAGRKRRVKAYVVAADMGLGHQRAVAPLADIAKGGLITMQDENWLHPKEKGVWHRTRTIYESVSRAGRIPVFGKLLLALMETVQKIPEFYPKRDLSAPTGAVKYLDRAIRKNRMGLRLVGEMRKDPAPLVTSFYAVAIAAEKQGYEGQIYCIICDSDFNRAWLPMDPKTSRIRYFAPCTTVAERLKMYGVPETSIMTTGFPLPKENVGGRSMKILRRDVADRLVRLDPENRFRRLHRRSLRFYLGGKLHKRPHDGPLSVMFAVGGAGAQVEIGLQLIRTLEERIRAREIVLTLVAGVRPEVAERFRKAVAALGLDAFPDSGVRIVHSPDMGGYMRAFNEALRTVDVLWTKPSELTFFGALGLPIIAAPPIGAHEELNYRWLDREGVALAQLDPRYADQWLIDWWRNGTLADHAWSGFLKLRKLGTYRIEDAVRDGRLAEDEDAFAR